jgi:hypothetical protein
MQSQLIQTFLDRNWPETATLVKVVDPPEDEEEEEGLIHITEIK